MGKYILKRDLTVVTKIVGYVKAWRKLFNDRKPVLYEVLVFQERWAFKKEFEEKMSTNFLGISLENPLPLVPTTWTAVIASR